MLSDQNCNEKLKGKEKQTLTTNSEVRSYCIFITCKRAGFVTQNLFTGQVPKTPAAISGFLGAEDGPAAAAAQGAQGATKPLQAARGEPLVAPPSGDRRRAALRRGPAVRSLDVLLSVAAGSDRPGQGKLLEHGAVEFLGPVPLSCRGQLGWAWFQGARGSGTESCLGSRLSLIQLQQRRVLHTK